MASNSDIKKGPNHYCIVEGESLNAAAINARATGAGML